MTKATRETSIHQLIHVPKTRKTTKKPKFEVTGYFSGYLARQVTQAHRKINQSKRRTMDHTCKARYAENSKWRQTEQVPNTSNLRLGPFERFSYILSNVYRWNILTSTPLYSFMNASFYRNKWTAVFSLSDGNR